MEQGLGSQRKLKLLMGIDFIKFVGNGSIDVLGFFHSVILQVTATVSSISSTVSSP